MEPLEKLRKLAKIILGDETAYSLGQEVWKLAELLGELSPIQVSDQIQTEGESKTAQGLALSPTMAARCASDIERAVVFSRGVHQAVREARRRAPDRPARLLYAGCGPYALLVLCSMATSSPEELQVSLLDIHEPSIASARAVIDAFDLGGFVQAHVTADACAYQITADGQPDIILSETMNAALEKEPQVSIARQLMTQAPDATLLPQSVRIDAYLVDPAKEYGCIEYQGDEAGRPEPDRVLLGTVFDLSADAIRSWPENEMEILPAVSVRIPGQMGRRDIAVLHTTVTVFGQQVLRVRDSGLTLPKPIPTDGALRGGETLHFHYRLGPHPALVCDVERGGTQTA